MSERKCTRNIFPHSHIGVVALTFVASWNTDLHFPLSAHSKVIMVCATMDNYVIFKATVMNIGDNYAKTNI